MEKKIEDYLHLYLGCPCQRMGEVDEDDKPKISILTGISYDDTQKEWWAYFENEESGYSVVSDVFPILRPLSSMTEEERIELDNIRGDNADTIMIPAPVFGMIHEFVPMVFHYLLSKHFDLFGLIESGLAIDSTPLNPINHDK